MKVTKDTNLGDLAKSYPRAAQIMLEYGLHCVGCFANAYDTVEMGARVHGMTDEEVQEMVDRINEAIAPAPAKAGSPCPNGLPERPDRPVRARYGRGQGA